MIQNVRPGFSNPSHPTRRTVNNPMRVFWRDCPRLHSQSMIHPRNDDAPMLSQLPGSRFSLISRLRQGTGLVGHIMVESSSASPFREHRAWIMHKSCKTFAQASVLPRRLCWTSVAWPSHLQRLELEFGVHGQHHLNLSCVERILHLRGSEKAQVLSFYCLGRLVSLVVAALTNATFLSRLAINPRSLLVSGRKTFLSNSRFWACSGQRPTQCRPSPERRHSTASNSSGSQTPRCPPTREALPNWYNAAISMP